MSEPQTGHNSAAQIKSLIERIENVGEQIKELQSDQKDIYQEAKGHGYDTKALRHIVRLRAEDPNKRAEREAILETYMHALGMV
jgi:uncharacterized protein (UPF0335 family)